MKRTEGTREVELITDRQWKWAEQLWRDGYIKKEIAGVLGLTLSTMSMRLCVDDATRSRAWLKEIRKTLPPIKTRLREAYQWWDAE